MTLLDDDTTPQAPERRVRRRTTRAIGAAALVILVALVAAAWLVVGLTPRLGQGSVNFADEEVTEPPPGFDVFGPDEQVVNDPSDGTVDGEWTFRNDGRLPVTLHVAEQSHGSDTTYVVQLRDQHGAVGEPGTAVAGLTVAPGEQFGVSYSIGPHCAEQSPGVAYGTDAVRLRVTTLGISRTLDVGTEFPVVYSTTAGHRPPAGCSS